MKNHPGKHMTIYDIPHIAKLALPSTATPVNIQNVLLVYDISPFNKDIFTDDDFMASNVHTKNAHNMSNLHHQQAMPHHLMMLMHHHALLRFQVCLLLRIFQLSKMLLLVCQVCLLHQLKMSFAPLLHQVICHLDMENLTDLIELLDHLR